MGIARKVTHKEFCINLCKENSMQYNSNQKQEKTLTSLHRNYNTHHKTLFRALNLYGSYMI